MTGGDEKIFRLPSNGVSIVCRDIQATRAVAEKLAAALRLGDVVLLDGSLAAGKTAFVTMVCRALGTFDQPTSPTYVIQNTYLCPKGEILHLDAYRLKGVDEFIELGVDEFLSNAVTFIEWGDRVLDAFDACLRVKIDFFESGAESRVYRFSGVGSRWTAFIASLAVNEKNTGEIK